MHILRIFVSLLFSLMTFSVAAEEIIVSYGGGDRIHIDSHNIDKQPFALKVESYKTSPDLFNFQVHVEPKQNGLSGLKGSTLSVISGKKQIVYAQLGKPVSKNGFAYEFLVSKKYLTRSEFGVYFNTRKNLPYADDYYYFLLKDFANEK